jgi:hypothetical protein
MILGFTMNGPDPDGSRENAELLQKSREFLAKMDAEKAEREQTRIRQAREFDQSIGRGR